MKKVTVLVAVTVSLAVWQLDRVTARNVGTDTGVAAAQTAAGGAQVPAPVSAAEGPFARESTLPYHMPPFDKIREADYRPAFEAGMAEQRKEVDAIAHNPEPASFDNTIVALERSGRTLSRVSTVFFELASSNTSDEIRAIQAEVAPKLSRHQDAIFLDSALFARIQKLFDQRKSLGLDAESLRLLERYQTLFARAGAALSDADKEKLRTLNEQLSTLTTRFQQTLLKATNDAVVVVDKVSDLDGLSPEQIAGAAEAAKERKLDGKWVITLENTTGQSVLADLKNRGLRERIFTASIRRANGGPDDNAATVASIVDLRARRAALLGFRDHATYMLEDETAGTPAAVNKMLAQLAPAVMVNTRKEAADLQAMIDQRAAQNHTTPFKLEPWDWAFYSELVRKARYDFDQSQVREYFELNRVLQDGLFYAAHELYGLTFKERHDLPVYNPDVRVFEVFNEDGSPLALFLADYFARDNKQGGAWMSEYVSQSKLLDHRPVVVNNLNVRKPPAGSPVLLTPDEVNTMFHEFGHALHGMFSKVSYPLFAGTSVPTDFVEFPSQVNEMWSRDPRVLAHFARHYRTGEPMPQVLLDKLAASVKFNQGFETLEYLEAAMMDQTWHQIPAGKTPQAKDVTAFEAAALKQAGVDLGAVPPRYHTPYFAHIFASGYSAGYYAYIWSDVLAKDGERWFQTHGGLDRANGDFLRAKVLCRGFSADPITLFKEFYGQAPDVQPLLEFRGLTATRKVP
jgi:peptidyl-dipeptidase Dcp